MVCMKKKPNWRPLVYWVLGSLAVGIVIIPNQYFAPVANNASQNLTLVTMLGRELTITAKVFGALALLLLGYIYNEKKK